jgi:hypothetical protein
MRYKRLSRDFLGSPRRGFLAEEMEARVRIELTRKGFADLSLTTWVPRLITHGLLPCSTKSGREV